jgi:hypothetical protein
MTPTPEVATSSSTLGIWIVIGVFGGVFVLIIASFVASRVSSEPRSLRRAGMRAGMAVDALYSGLDRRAAIEYVLDEQQAVVLDQERGEGEG